MTAWKCGMTCACVSHINIPIRLIYKCVTWLMHMCDTSAYQSWLLYKYDMTCLYVDTSMYQSWLLDKCDITCSYICVTHRRINRDVRDSSICVTWLMYMCDTSAYQSWLLYKCDISCLYKCVTYQMCDISMYQSWLRDKSDMTCSYTCVTHRRINRDVRDSSICVTWLMHTCGISTVVIS